MTQRALVTGCDGFVGSALCSFLIARGWEVIGCARSGAKAVGRSERRLVCDVTDANQVRRVFDACPSLTHVFHLAALTNVPEAIRDPAGAFKTNVEGTMTVLAEVANLDADIRVVFAGSSEVYGQPQTLPVDEDHPLNPRNPYAESKAAADSYCREFHEREGLHVVRLRLFNHSGPGQSERFVLSSFAQQIARIEAGEMKPLIRVGNLNAARDFLHVDDVVRAYEAAALRGVAGEVYNVCRGEAVTMRAALDLFLGLSSVVIDEEVDEARHRPNDTPVVYGSHARMTEATGWSPQLEFARIVEDLLRHARESHRWIKG